MQNQKCKFIAFDTIGVCICEPKIADYLKLKKDDRLFVSSEIWARIRPEMFLKVWPEPGPKSPTKLATL